MNFLQRVRSILGLAIFLASSAHAQNAPNAGGYAGDFGSDYGVGRVQIKGVREAVAVVGVAGRDRKGRAVPWLGLRFGQELGETLRAPMRQSADSAAIARYLAAREVRFWDASAWQFHKTQTPRGAKVLGAASYRKSFPLWVSGVVVIDGAASSPASKLQIQVRAWRWEKANLRPASEVVALEAPLSEWPQLSSRAALALLDALRVPLSEDERTAFLREASPLQPAATAPRLAAETKLGTMQADALECDILARGAKSANVKSANVKSANAQSAKASKARGEAAKKALNQLLKLPTASTISDGDAFRRIHGSAQSWKPYVLGVSRSANRSAQR